MAIGSRLAEHVAAKAPRRIKFAAAIASVPPGGTEIVQLMLSPTGRKIIRTSKKRRLSGVMEITNSAALDLTTVRVRIK